VNAADAIQWITEQKSKNPNKPWHVWLTFNLSHITGNPKPNPMIVPNIDTMDEVSIKEMKACGGTFGSAIVGSCSSEALMRAMTNSMDTIIRKVLDVVDKLDPNTYVIYLGDNGTWMFGTGREFIDNMYITKQERSKGIGHESGAASRWRSGERASKPVPKRRADPCVDLFSTILELQASVPKPFPTRPATAPWPSTRLPPQSFSRGQRACAIPIKAICSRRP
jgi:hypothetical protein